MKRIGRFLADIWQPAIGFTVAACFLTLLLGFKLGTLNKGWSQPELKARNSSLSVKVILKNPINAPHKAGQYLMLKSGFTSPQSLRAISAIVGFLAVFMFYILIKRWHTRRIAVISTLLFATSSFFLTIARNATPTVMWLGLLIFIAAALHFRHTRRPKLALFTLILFAGLAMYVPGMIWFLILALGWQWNMLPKLFKHIKTWQAGLAILFFLVLIAPLVYGIIRDLDLLKVLFVIPDHLSWQDAVANIGEVPGMLFFKAPHNPLYWLGTLPILDIFATVMFTLGLYSFRHRFKMDRTAAVIAIFIISSILIAVSGTTEMVALMLPFVYVIVAGGITLMLQQWFTVFPFNPIARTLGPAIISIAVLVTASYHIARYYIAWPNAPATKIVYNQKP